jgi:flagellar biosynthesis protein FlhF
MIRRSHSASASMSTLSFQDFVRERAMVGRSEKSVSDDRKSVTEASGASSAPSVDYRSLFGAADPSEVASQGDDSALIKLQQMHLELSRQLASLAWMNLRYRDPIRSELLQVLLESGFSGPVARSISDGAPVNESFEAAKRWQQRRLTQLIRSNGDASRLLETGGVYALIGPTGSGKTTTVAKLAAQFALRHGVQSVGLVTIDAYRVGAQEQLCTFGRLLGVRVLVGHDPRGMAGLLKQFMGKKLVLIDTCGLGQRDERVEDLLSSLAAPLIRKLLVLNATSQAETIEDVIRAYKSREAAGVIVSKIDEAVKVGHIVDSVIRHRLELTGISDGQRVPEDWHSADAAMLVERALVAPRRGPFRLDDDQLAHALGGARLTTSRRDTRPGQALHG